MFEGWRRASVGQPDTGPGSPRLRRHAPTLPQVMCLQGDLSPTKHRWPNESIKAIRSVAHANNEPSRASRIRRSSSRRKAGSSSGPSGRGAARKATPPSDSL
jgi:hypothetical protein